MSEKKQNPFCTIPPEEVESVPETLKGYLKTIKDTRDALKWVWNRMNGESHRRTRHFLWALGISTVMSAVFPRLITVLYQSVPERSSTYIAIGMGGIVGCYFIKQFTQYIQETAREWVAGLNIGSLDRFITERIFSHSIGQRIQEAKLLNNANITKGRERTLQTESMLLHDGFAALFSLFLVWCLLWTVSVMAGAILTVALIIYIAWALYLNYRVAVVCTPLDVEIRLLQRYRAERWKKVQRVKTAGRTEEELEFMSAWFDDFIGRDREFWLWYARQSSKRRIVGVVSILSIITYGLVSMLRDPSYAPYFFPLVMWSVQIIENMWQVGNVEHNLHWNLPAIQSLIRALELKPDVVNAPNAVTLDPVEPLTIEFRNVGHTYSSRARTKDQEKTLPPVLRDINFTINPGEKVAILGPSGVGKSTLFSLLLRAYNHTSGQILVNGHPLQNIDLDCWAQTVGYVPQRSIIFNQTIRYNMLYELTPDERAQVTEAQLWEVACLFKMDLGERLVDGLDTVVGEDGMELSGGQTQRLALCGAFLKLQLALAKQAKLMLVDEATSHLDSVTEQAVQESFELILGEGVTALFIAHRLSTVRKICTKFIVLAESNGEGGGGSIEAVAGSFEELYTVSPTFRKLADTQGIVINTNRIHAVA